MIIYKNIKLDDSLYTLHAFLLKTSFVLLRSFSLRSVSPVLIGAVHMLRHLPLAVLLLVLVLSFGLVLVLSFGLL